MAGAPAWASQDHWGRMALETWSPGGWGEGVWRRPGTQSVFEPQQLSREQAATELEISRKAGIGLRGSVDGVFTVTVVFICRQVEALGREARTP